MMFSEVRRLHISSDMIYGYTDSIILHCLMEKDSYGYEINNSILQKTQNCYELKEATLYTTFHRLEKQGYVNSYWGERSEGACRRYYSITEQGKAYYQRRIDEWETIKRLLDALFS